MLSALAKGQSRIEGLLEGEDVLCTAAAMRAMGAEIERQDNGTWIVNGAGLGNLKQPAGPIYMGNSGTSARLLMGLIAGHAITATMTGDASLTKRPMGRVIKPLSQMGAAFDAAEGDRLPLMVHGAKDIKPIDYELPVASAQVKSAIILAGLNANGTTSITENKPTRDHTEKMLKHFGVHVDIIDLGQGRSRISLKGGQNLKPGIINVPADPSSAAFPAVAALITGSEGLTIKNVLRNDRRDGLYKVLTMMGADIRFDNETTEAGERVADLVIKSSAPLKGVDIPPELVPSMIDEFPVLAMAAACAQGTTRMTDLAELRVKESDRLLMVAEGLKACGADLEMGEDSLTIHGTSKPPKGGALIKTALDHRIAMSFLVLGCAAEDPITIDDASPINTSFPGFQDLMNTIGAEIKDEMP